MSSRKQYLEKQQSVSSSSKSLSWRPPQKKPRFFGNGGPKTLRTLTFATPTSQTNPNTYGERRGRRGGGGARVAHKVYFNISNTMSVAHSNRLPVVGVDHLREESRDFYNFFLMRRYWHIRIWANMWLFLLFLGSFFWGFGRFWSTLLIFSSE